MKITDIKKLTFEEKYNLASHNETSVELLSALAKDETIIRAMVAENKSTPPKILSELAHDTERNVREAVARNKNTPIEVLSKLAVDSDWRVRRVVAGMSNTPIEILSQLAVDSDWRVR